MVGYVAQIITIASYGNEFLNDGIEKLDSRSHSSFHAIGDPAFKDKVSHDFDDVLDTNEWFHYLKDHGCRKIRIFYNVVDESISGVMIDESIEWLLETVFDDYSDFWTYDFRYGSSGWWARVIKTASHQPIMKRHDDLELRKRDLDAKLEVMIEYAKILGWGNGPRIFRNMKTNLYEKIPVLPEFHSQLIVEKNYSLTARQVLYAAVSAWCFTGMGSWSDNCGSSEESRITRDLFYSVCNAYVAAVNSY